MSLVVGTLSKSKLFEIFQTAIHEIIRQKGLPAEVSIKAEENEIVSRSKDFAKRVDYFRFDFPVKPGSDPEVIKGQLEAARIPNQTKIDDGKCSITLPSFEWSQLRQLEPVDRIVVEHARSSIRSRSWQVSIGSFSRFDFNINVLIEEMLQKKGSDIHLRAGAPPYMRIDSDLEPLDLPPLSADDMREVVFQLGGQQQLDILDAEKESSFQYHLAGLCYLRCSGFIKMGAMALAIRF
ncbi:MAG: hypothetical protein WC655_01365, partial [Candidatus Hydrogenedentales bacterium]